MKNTPLNEKHEEDWELPIRAPFSFAEGADFEEERIFASPPLGTKIHPPFQIDDRPLIPPGINVDVN